MTSALAFVQELSSPDLDWLFREADDQRLAAGAVIIEEGALPDSLFLVMEGVFSVRYRVAGPLPVAKLGPGELVGDMSFLDGLGASASVVCDEPARVLRLARAVLADQLAADGGFASRFYRALAVTNAARLRATVGALGVRLHHAGAAGGGEAFDRVRLASAEGLERFKTLMAAVDRDALANHGDVPDVRREEVRQTFDQLAIQLNQLTGTHSALPDGLKEQIGRTVQRELLPYLLLTQNGERMYAKPRGYAGDYLTIGWMYDNVPAGTGRLGPLLDECLLAQPAAQAVRNRRGILRDEIHAVIEARGAAPARVCSLACGPAREVLDVFQGLDDPTQLCATLIDIDSEALDHVRRAVDAAGLSARVTLVQGNLLHLAAGRQKVDLPPQDLIYSIGLVDYFGDKHVVALLDFIHRALAPGGRVILGNFHADNPSRGLMDWLLDWRLIHRTEEDMDRLFTASAFGRPCTDVCIEPAGVNLFAACRKEGG